MAYSAVCLAGISIEGDELTRGAHLGWGGGSRLGCFWRGLLGPRLDDAGEYIAIQGREPPAPAEPYWHQSQARVRYRAWLHVVLSRCAARRKLRDQAVD